jgi:hypothetical protein
MESISYWDQTDLSIDTLYKKYICLLFLFGY